MSHTPDIVEPAAHGPKIYKVGTLTYTKPKLAILCFWLLWGDVCYQLMETVGPSILPLKLNSLQAPNWMLGLLVTTIPNVISFFLNPMISFKSDRFRSPWGRRIPFIVVSMPFLVFCLISVGFGDRLGFWLHGHLAALGRFSPNTIAIAAMGLFWVTFSFFNNFVGSVFWYLFNDVVPEHLLARFISWFRLVSQGTAAMYSFFLYQHALDHTAAIFTGAGLLYFFGFGLMCLNVKEGKYPPPPENIGGQVGPLAAAKTYGKECFSLPHYRYQFLCTFFGSISNGIGTFGVFGAFAIGLNLHMMGILGGISTATGSVLILASGWLADRFHPIRVVLAGQIAGVALSPLGAIWLFWHPSPNVVFWYCLISGIVLSGPIGACMGVWDPPLFMRFFPRDRYGQFCSANAMCRAAGLILGGTLAGIYLDVVKRIVGETCPWDHNNHYYPYLFSFLWSMCFAIPVLFFLIKQYRSWQRYGGDDSYIPPMPAGDSIDTMSGPAWEKEIDT